MSYPKNEFKKIVKLLWLRGRVFENKRKTEGSQVHTIALTNLKTFQIVFVNTITLYFFKFCQFYPRLFF